MYEHYRVCLHSNSQQLFWSRPSGKLTRSLLLFAASDKYPIEDDRASEALEGFKLLRVLDMGPLRVCEFPTALLLLVHLRYLAMQVETKIVPPSLADLWNLETVIIKGHRGEVVLPDTIWKMAKLRHLHINERLAFGSDDKGEENHENSQHLLDNLETISTPCLQYGKNSEKILRKLHNVQKLRCIFLDSWGVIGYREARRTCNRFPKLEILSQLESLKVLYHGKRLHPCEFSFPSKLKKLTLSKFRLPWNEISTIGKLSNLEILKLRFKAFEGPIWDMIDGEFTNLKYLELDSPDISEWNACSDPFPSLRKLILKSCKQLKEVPSSFGDIRMLERIEVHWCSRSATDSVLQIRKDQKEEGNEEIHFSILPQDWDIEPSSDELEN